MMARPLAAAGFCALLTLVIALYFLPSAALLPLAVLLLLTALLLRLFCGKNRRTACAVLLCAVAAISLMRAAAEEKLRVAQVLRWEDGAVHRVQGEVCELENGLYENVYGVCLRVTAVDGTRCHPFRVVCSNVENGAPGDLMQLQVKFQQYTPSYRLRQYGKGIFLRALQQQPGEEILLGQSGRPMAAAARLRARLGAKFQILGRTTGGIAAAMVVGERSRLEYATRERFRSAGISHTLVISGLHLSSLAYLLYRGLRWRWMLRIRPASFLTILFIAFYMFLTGMTVSVVRAGVLTIMALLSQCLVRNSDPITAMGCSLVILLAVNPFAACDVGLLLSFSATLGVMCFSRLNERHFRLYRLPVGSGAVQALASTLSAMLFTLPVLAMDGTTLSVGMLLCNALCLPLMLPILILGWIFLLTYQLFGFSVPLLSGQLLRQLLQAVDGIVQWVDRTFSDRLGISGLAAVVILCAAGLVTFLLYCSELRRHCAVIGLACLAALIGSYAALNVSTVSVALVGSSVNPPVVISQNRECVVLFRGAFGNADDVTEYLQLHNLHSPQQVINLGEPQTETVLRKKFDSEPFEAREMEGYIRRFDCLDDVTLTVLHQKRGCICFISAADCSIGVSSGPVDYSGYPECSLFLAGYSRPEGLRTQRIVCNEKSYSWIAACENAVVFSGAEPTVWLRPGAALRVLT